MHAIFLGLPDLSAYIRLKKDSEPEINFTLIGHLTNDVKIDYKINYGKYTMPEIVNGAMLCFLFFFKIQISINNYEKKVIRNKFVYQNQEYLTSSPNDRIRPNSKHL